MTRPIVIACIVALVATLACTAAQRTHARSAGAAGAVAVLDCEAAHLDAQALADAKAFASAKVQAWISGSGAANSAAIRADLAPIKSDLGRCAIAGAIAAIGAALTSSPGVAVSALMSEPTPAMRVQAGYGAAVHDLGWPSVKAAK